MCVLHRPHVGHLETEYPMCVAFGTPCGPSQQLHSSTHNVRHFGPHVGNHSTPRGKKLERIPHCASLRTPMIHVYSQVDMVFNALRAARVRVRETASTPGLRW